MIPEQTHTENQAHNMSTFFITSWQDSVKVQISDFSPPTIRSDHITACQKQQRPLLEKHSKR